MALIPVLAYPGQTLPVSSGYPYGAARNVAVAGDGTGTPLEAQWVNDVWGFLQALLQGGVVVPSTVPDTAVASDYLTATKAIVLSHAAANLHAYANFLNKSYAWTGDHAFTYNSGSNSVTFGDLVIFTSDTSVDFAGATRFATTVALNGASNEVLYSPARSRTKLHSLDGVVGFGSGPALRGAAGVSLSSGPQTYSMVLDIPTGCTLTNVTAAATSGVAASVQTSIEVFVHTPDLATPAVGTANSLGSFTSPSSGSHILPVVIGDDGRTMEVASALQQRGFDVRGIRPPTVPTGTSRLRISLTLNVDEAAVAALADAVKELR